MTAVWMQPMRTMRMPRTPSPPWQLLVLILLLSADTAKAVIGNMGFMKFRNVPGGFNMDIPPEQWLWDEETGEAQLVTTTTSIVTTIPILETAAAAKKAKKLEEAQARAATLKAQKEAKAAALKAKAAALKAKQEQARKEAEAAALAKQKAKEAALKAKQEAAEKARKEAEAAAQAKEQARAAALKEKQEAAAQAKKDAEAAAQAKQEARAAALKEKQEAAEQARKEAEAAAEARKEAKAAALKEKQEAAEKARKEAEAAAQAKQEAKAAALKAKQEAAAQAKKEAEEAAQARKEAKAAALQAKQEAAEQARKEAEAAAQAKQEAKAAALKAKQEAAEKERKEAEAAAQARQEARAAAQAQKAAALQAKRAERQAKREAAAALRRQRPVTPVAFDAAPLIKFEQLLLAANAAGCAVSLALAACDIGTHYHVDLFGTGSLAAAALAVADTGNNNNSRVALTSAATAVWSAKLAGYLVMRLATEQDGVDDRLTPILSNAPFCVGFWAFSVLWGTVCGLPYSIGLMSDSPGNDIVTKAGLGLCGVGWLMETVADLQKWQWKRSAETGEFLQTGLWSLSQHPNWFGTTLVWSGLCLANLPALYDPPLAEKKDGESKTTKPLQGPQLWLARLWGCRRMVLAAVGPWFLWRMFHQQATGEMLGDTFAANREKYGYGSNADYTNYIDNTPLIIPKQLQITTTLPSVE